MPTAREVIEQHPTNEIETPNITSYTNKTWAQGFKSITNFCKGTRVDPNTGIFHSNFDHAPHPLDNDDEKRLKEPAAFPNLRSWRLETEADIEHWWHTEISDPVLSAWAKYPRLQQTCHTQPLSNISIAENIDATYAMYMGNLRVPVVIGEIKRNLIDQDVWQSGALTEAQTKLARELRGYAVKYECPQVFCWDGRTLLLLQFRAQMASQMLAEDCPVDCWVIPINNSNCTFRYALYRLLAQGFRRCQTISAPLPTVAGLTASDREFYTGRPIWTVYGVHSLDHPLGHFRRADAESGALGWRNHDGDVTWETEALW
ncbi:hypothetical protein PT974_01024 [Cladobotryum mycophilum]|uniref:Uncharacterized protein n=1 Tax=Cladobotryum mycophilum TaxID=491253 RepID=A0ABR0T2M1_9HYPO